ncbi:MAG: tetratricopeptide repeat protein [Spirochaetaceae bacterium]|jgi:Flp pilus assembly protein TadD|nr:tetratricopeptide repeat protein [Spirochaetaceae bacterium]
MQKEYSAQELNNQGIALTEADKSEEAIALFHEALKIEPWNPLLYLNLAIAEQKNGNCQAAEENFKAALAIDTKLGEAQAGLGLIHYGRGEFEEARHCYLLALENNCCIPKVMNNLGVLDFINGDFESARSCFESALSLMPNYKDAILNLQDVHSKDKR